MESRNTALEEKCCSKDDDIYMLQQKLDGFEQREKNNNVIVTGLEANTKDEFVEKLNSTLEIDINKEDVLSTHDFKTKDNKTRTRIVFKDHETKSKVYRSKRKLKNKKIYMSEDLTVYRSRVYYFARKAVVNEYATAAWTMDGNIYIKHAHKPKPKKVSTTEEIGEFLEIEA